MLLLAHKVQPCRNILPDAVHFLQVIGTNVAKQTSDCVACTAAADDTVQQSAASPTQAAREAAEEAAKHAAKAVAREAISTTPAPPGHAASVCTPGSIDLQGPGEPSALVSICLFPT